MYKRQLKRYQVHVKAAGKIIEYLSATVHLGLMCRKDNKLEDVQLEYDLETYVDTDDAHKADDRRSVSGVAVYCGDTIVPCFPRRRNVSPYSLQKLST